jgi:hypothetical protein
MLGYLDSLISALNERETPDIDRLLAHPLARILPAEARREAEAFRDGAVDVLATPLRVLQLRHQTAELLRASTLPAPAPLMAPPRVSLSPRDRQRTPPAQMELPLSA